MSHYTDTELLALAAELAENAADIIRAIRSSGFETKIKADSSPVTEADQKSEKYILDKLRTATPYIPVIAEEEVSTGIHNTAGNTYWLVDPLDGTREFAAGRDDFTVNIGLVRHGRAVLGAMALPAYHQLYTGRVGVGAWRRDARGVKAIHARRPPDHGLTVLASRHYAHDQRLTHYLERYPLATISHIGSAVKFARIAEGVADFYPRLGPTMEWDTAAPQAIVEAAGGCVTLFDESTLLYSKTKWKNPPFICRGII
ncbi:MAG: 3'(2'),5'-bisphosphate nucleotidase CysQ [Acetobacter sp.]|nr:3'(2'),5'-bisphosphate nucleotidase CysQ [Acetobacter sp.]